MIELYKTGEIHSNGQDVYRRVGDKPKSGQYLLGTYFIGDESEMSVCGKGYVDEYGVWDGEPISGIYLFKIVEVDL